MVGTPSVDVAMSRVGQHLLQYLHEETDARWSITAAPTGTSFAIPRHDGGALSFLCVSAVGDPERHARLGETVAHALGQIAEAEARSAIVLQDLSTPVSNTAGGTDGRLIAYFQPIVEMRTGEVVAVEALARLQTADGVLGPESFLSEYSTGPAMLTLFDRMLESALQFLSERRHRMPDLSAAINLEFAGVPETGLVELVQRRLEEFQTNPDSLTIELNERVAFQLTPAAVAQLMQLVELGVKLLLDDMPASFASLQSLQISGVKLDRRFVKQMNGSPYGLDEVRGILARAGHAGMDVIAEGVESQAQCDQLIALGCTFGQGYFFAVPQPASSLAAVLDAPLVGSW
jgi:EAL domain-containing protein (putative c-di-GMP-specific phosphodiesterase class I)